MTISTPKWRSAVAAALAVAGATTGVPQASGAVPALPGHGAALSVGAPASVSFAPAVYMPGWTFVKATGGVGGSGGAQDLAWSPFSVEPGGGDNVASGVLRFAGRVSYRDAPDGAVEGDWRIVPDRDAAIEEAFVHSRIPVARCADGFLVDGRRSVVLPASADRMHLYRGPASRFSILGEGGVPWLDVEFPDGPVQILVQDNRTWGRPVVLLRFFFAKNAVEAGREYAVRACFKIPGKALALDFSPPVRVEAGPEWVPFRPPAPGEDWIEPGSALDFSHAAARHEPAGKFGRVVVAGDHFEFADRPGESVRFCGANICYGANFPDLAEARRFAANYARFGYNAIRIHHHDGAWAEAMPEARRNRGDAASAPRDGGGAVATSSDTGLARFDGLVAALVERGIYITTDLYVQRKPAWRECGIDRDGRMSKEDFKILAAFHEGVFSNLCAFARSFLLHENPHTGRCLAEEPALACLALVNEGNLGNWGSAKLREYPEVAAAWLKWQTERGAASPIADLPDDVDDPALALFLAEREETHFRRLAAVVRDECGCRAPLSSLSSWFDPAQYLLPRRLFDYVDDHGYIDHPRFPDRAWHLPAAHDGTNPLRGGDGTVPAVRRRLFGKPFCVTEWNWCTPNRFRGASGLVMGALAARQDWTGLWRFAWSHSLEDLARPGLQPMRWFDLASDPVLQASERGALCLFLRGDVAPLPRGREDAEAFSEEALRSTGSKAARLGQPRPGAASPWEARVGVRLLENGAGGDAASAPASGAEAQVAGDEAAADVDPAAGSFRVVSRRTAGGFAESGRMECGPLSFNLAVSGEVQSNPAVSGEACPAAVWVSSLDGAPIEDSSRLLLSHLTDAKNVGMAFDGPDMLTTLDFGSAPALVRRGRADIALSFSPGRPRPSVFRLAASGCRAEEVATTYDEASGRLAFAADTAMNPDSATLCYEIAFPKPERSVYFATHFHNWYEEAGD